MTTQRCGGELGEAQDGREIYIFYHSKANKKKIKTDSIHLLIFIINGFDRYENAFMGFFLMLMASLCMRDILFLPNQIRSDSECHLPR